MKEWLKEAIACYKFHIPYANGNGKFLWIFIVSLVLILLWRKKEEPHQRFGWYLAVLLLLVLNPFFVPLLNTAAAGDYWRCLWLLGLPFVIAFAFTRIVSTFQRNAVRVLTAGVLSAVIVLTGLFQYNKGNFLQSENLYKIPGEAIEICELVHDHVEKPRLATPEEVNIWIRQYDATIQLGVTRFGGGDPELVTLINAEEPYDLAAIRDRACEKKCNCLALRKNQLPDTVEIPGVRLIGVTAQDSYAIFYLEDSPRGGYIGDEEVG